MRLSFNNLVGLFLLACLVSCSKAKTYDSTPSISMVGISSTTVHAFTDSLVFTIAYEDGDGDLGENNPDVKNCFVTDNHLAITYSYRISQLAPSNANVPIKGQVNIVLNHVAVADSSPSTSTNFSIYVMDRAGHKSNTVNSDQVTIVQ